MRIPTAIAACVLTLAAAPCGAQGTGASRPGFDVLQYEFAVAFSPRGLQDTVRVTSTSLVARTAGDPALRFDLGPAMRVTGVRVNSAPASFTRDSVSVVVALPAGRGDTLAIAIDARGIPTDGLVLRRDSSSGAWTAFADHFPDRARAWLATIDHPSDKATVGWAVTAPATHRVIANGELLEETPIPARAGGTTMLLTRWQSRRPLYTAVMVIGVAPFARFELGATACGLGEQPGCVAQSVWTSPDARPTLPGAFARAGEMVAFFSRLAGPFPYEKLAHVQSATRYGGMENASAIFYADAIVRGGRMSEGLVAHETAHQWFGDAVTTRAWPHVWLSEGFATYFAALWAEHAQGDSALVRELRAMRETVLDAPISREKPIIDEGLSDLGRVLNSNVYQKAGFALHMLRREVGDSAFFGAIRAYYAAHRHGTALTGDFQQAVERASGQHLDWFFDQWFRRPGVADATVAWRWEPAERALRLTVSQGATFPAYRLNLSLDVTDDTGTTRRVRVTVPASRVATVIVPLALEAAPRNVTFDPDASFLGRLVVAR